MSVATPAAASTPEAATPPTIVLQEPTIDDRQVVEYLRSRGYKAAEEALLSSLEPNSPGDKGKQPETRVSPTVSGEEFARQNAVFAQRPSKPGENVFKETSNVLQELSAVGAPPPIQQLIANTTSIGAEELLSVDPTDRQEGFRELEAWVDGSLDMYRVRPTHFSFTITD